MVGVYLTNVQSKHIKKCHNESSLYSYCMKIRNSQTVGSFLSENG
jgi:hypothetical protein